MPVLGTHSKPIDYDPYNMSLVVRYLLHMDRASWVIEKPIRTPKSGRRAVAQSHMCAGIWRGLLKDLSFIWVHPRTWQSKILKGLPGETTKERSIHFARCEYPDVDLTPGRLKKPHDGIADAICIARWWLQYGLTAVEPSNSAKSTKDSTTAGLPPTHV